MLLRQFREQHFPVDGNVAQTVQRAAFKEEISSQNMTDSIDFST